MPYNFFLDRYADSYVNIMSAFVEYVKTGDESLEPALGIDGKVTIFIGEKRRRKRRGWWWWWRHKLTVVRTLDFFLCRCHVGKHRALSRRPPGGHRSLPDSTAVCTASKYLSSTEQVRVEEETILRHGRERIRHPDASSRLPGQDVLLTVPCSSPPIFLVRHAC